MEREALGLVVIATLISWPTSARALEGDGSSPGLFGPLHLEAAGRAEVAALSTPRYAWPGPGEGGGVGARAGASYLGIYGGLTYMDYLTEESGTDFTSSGSGRGTSHGFSYGFEGGYGRIFAQRLIVRAQLGIGDHAINNEGTTVTCQGFSVGAPCSTSTSHSSTHYLYLEPALLIALSFGPLLAGIDGSVFFMPHAGDDLAIGSTTVTQFRVGAQLGVRL